MRDVEDQLRIYGDAVESEQAKGPYATTVVDVVARRPRHGLLVAGALVAVVALAAGVTFAATRGRSHTTSAVRTTGTRPRSTSGKITASLRLDKATVHQGEDIVGTVTFDNRTGHVVAFTSGSNACLGRWQVALGKDDPDRAAEYSDCDTAGTNRRALKFGPGRHRIRILLPTTFNSCGERGEPRCGAAPLQAPLLPPQRTQVWLVAPKGIVRPVHPQPLRILGPPKIPFCSATNLAVADGGPILTTTTRPAGVTVHRLVVRNTGRRTCQLDGAPATWVSTPAVNVEPPLIDARTPRPERVILRLSSQASFLADVAETAAFATPLAMRDACLTSTRIHLRLPDQGGSLDLAAESVPADHTGERAPPPVPGAGLVRSATLACTSSITALTGFVPGAHADATLLDPSRPTKRHV